MERWKPIPGTKERLYVSNYGRVKSFLRNKTEGNILRPTKDHKGYLRLRVTLDGLRYSYKIHRLVASAFIENPENKAQVNHKDGNKENNVVSNLEWSNNKENARHAMEHDLWRNVLAASSMSNEAKKVAIISTEISTGKEIRFGCISDAERYFHSKHISAVLNGKRKQTAGHVFRREVMQQ